MIAELWGWELRVPSVRPGLISLTGATYPGSESGTCFRAIRLVPAGAGTPGYENRGADWCRCLGVVGATLPLWIPAFAGMTIPNGRGRSPSCGAGSYGGTTGILTGATYPGSESGTCFRANRSCWRRSCLPQPLWTENQSSPIDGEGGGPYLSGRTTLPPLAGDKRRRYRALWCWVLAPAVRVCLSSGGCGKRLEG